MSERAVLTVNNRRNLVINRISVHDTHSLQASSTPAASALEQRGETSVHRGVGMQEASSGASLEPGQTCNRSGVSPASCWARRHTHRKPSFQNLTALLKTRSLVTMHWK